MASFSRPRLAAVIACLALTAAFAAQTALAQNARRPAARTTDAAETAFELSKKAVTIEQFTDVIAACDQVLAAKPSEKQAKYATKLAAWSYNQRGEVRLKAKQDKEALADFEKAVALDPTAWRALHNRGVSYATQNKFAEAAADFDEVIRLEKGYPAAWFNRAELRSRSGNYLEAIDDYNRAIKLKAEDVDALIGRGYAYIQVEQLDAAMADYNRALQVDPNSVKALVFRANLNASIGDFGPAADDYRTAIRMQPDLSFAYLGAAWLMATCPDERFRDPTLSIKAARKAIELSTEPNCRNWETLAAALASAGQFDEAAEAQRKAIDAAPADVPEVAAELKERLQLYQDKHPYREVQYVEEVAAPKTARRQEQ
jgi:tetratricopeptide (TPR) repeat protein